MGSVAIAPLIAGFALLAAAAVTLVQRRHQAQLVGRAVDREAEDGADILYFTGVACTICHVAQRPALARLVEARSDIRVREIDIAEEPDLARRYRVMTLPTTVVLGSSQRIVAVNTGFTTESVLTAQVDGARCPEAQVSLA